MPIAQPSHVFEAHLVWSGAAHGPTRDAATFSRNLDVSFDPLTLAMSAAPGFRGDGSRANPEQLFVAAVSSCQALTYLVLAARHGVAVVAYEDVAEGALEFVDGAMRMSRVTLRPRIVLEARADVDLARGLVDKAHRGCFIANSVSTAIGIEPRIELSEQVEAVKGLL